MTLKPTDEMREALGRRPGHRIEVEDDRTRKLYVPVDRDGISGLVEDALQVGLDQSDRGESEPWGADEFLAEAHRRHARRGA